MEYVVARGLGRTNEEASIELEKKVRILRLDGWKPQGKISITVISSKNPPIRACQTLIRDHIDY